MKKLSMLTLVALTIASCQGKTEQQPVQEVLAKPTVTTPKVIKKRGVTEITTVEQFQEIIKQKDRLMIFDLYAEWCGPCKQLAPILDTIEGTHGEEADFYKINTEKLPSLSRAFQVKGIPHVVFFKDGGIANAYTGLYPKEAYEQSVEILALPLSDTADGKLKKGTREITISGDKRKGNIVTYRGDVVELTIKATGKPFTVAVENLDVKGYLQSDGKKDVTLSFKVKELGFFPLLLKDDSGRNDRIWIGVIQFSDAKGSYKEVNEKEFAEAIKKDDSFLLDVRSKGEYNAGHIKGATLIPVQDLEKRINELSAQKDKTILVYCRSGNRSTVAANLLKNAGFGSIVNLRPGIKAWKRANLPLEK